jgi:ATP-dependent RNA helicase DDX24/MAK5
MAPEQKKRSRPVPSSSQRSKKRQKIDPVKAGEPLKKRPVAVDALPWNEVKMPEMFDDAEGFYGLEEVEGVEIIRDGGTVQFVGLPFKPR